MAIYEVTWNPSPGSNPVNGASRWREEFDGRAMAKAFKDSLPEDCKAKMKKVAE